MKRIPQKWNTHVSKVEVSKPEAKRIDTTPNPKPRNILIKVNIYIYHGADIICGVSIKFGRIYPPYIVVKIERINKMYIFNWFAFILIYLKKTLEYPQYYNGR